MLWIDCLFHLIEKIQLIWKAFVFTLVHGLRMSSNCLNFQGVSLHVWILVVEAVEDKMKITNVSKILPLIIVIIIIIAILCLELAGILSI